ncbi:MAG: DUF1573 domain-containing protein [Chlorobi bacterium]|nr:DUF1573 domain-containing protein [Chlorobiota bacterium]MCI0717298.1 DUF1573 domain-containing protein [Chlorobiota bacterium]
MKKSIIAIFLLPLLTFAQSGPKMEVEGGNTINTGNHLRGKEVVHEVKFKNTGDEDLKITSVGTSCGCSSALVSSDLIKAGESGSIKFTFNGQAFGQTMKSLMVSTNEKENNYHNIQISMNMIDPLSINPQSIITEGRVGEELKQIATITNSLDKEVDITELTSNTPVIKVTSDKMALGSGEAALLDILIKIYEESAINAAIIIKTTEGEFQIPVLVDVKPN